MPRSPRAQLSMAAALATMLQSQTFRRYQHERQVLAQTVLDVLRVAGAAAVNPCTSTSTAGFSKLPVQISSKRQEQKSIPLKAKPCNEKQFPLSSLSNNNAASFH